jgi:hypothetical protein
MNSPDTYQKLDRAALWLVVGEFGLLALLGLLIILMVVGNMISYDAFNFGYNTGEMVALGIGLVYGVAYLGNLFIGIAGLYLYASEKREGYPGTGHLVNWVVVSSTIFIAVIFIAAVLTSI